LETVYATRDTLQTNLETLTLFLWVFKKGVESINQSKLSSPFSNFLEKTGEFEEIYDIVSRKKNRKKLC
jgi:type II secretory pathway component PulF